MAFYFNVSECEGLFVKAAYKIFLGTLLISNFHFFLGCRELEICNKPTYHSFVHNLQRFCTVSKQSTSFWRLQSSQMRPF